ncbi:polysaccharide biosynthesis/export family protein [Riemerella anatipestifer]|uniref:polysaccharide biosynthesis/export family protein n=2 Tax=Riemerella anatipestifer TaxID=34085 RepID=UPI00208EF87B|nr:polysaccharide biosynthesis/export family protein [Riemerella anatipestifer]MCO4303035.1 polysaccharide biosynthesis/export family protein [Riemerella anatipestifer]MCO7353167.1 polysaccharide biosynthesis/export family protein [Riemerella anatipestifer]MCT6760130.1 polysaccharide biosynthesis/export family protein [Riemerella anatipestifer]MCT6767396.1 polysaccharide biosynthesis/export family protein [Riemerella anatipestifer]MCT6772667.1 polysaccharide biosynthesis/export family protein 
MEFMKARNYLTLLFVSLFIFSCKTKNDIEYMQDIEKQAEDAYTRASQTTIQRGDEISILVTAKDMSVVAPFNQGSTPSNKLGAYSLSEGNSPTINQAPISGFTYTVYDTGYIDFPVLGKIDTNGKTLEDLKQELSNKLKRYIVNPTVSVKYTNYKVTVLGEVNRPGQYIIPDGKTRIVDALGLAGDLTIYGKRDRVLVVREQDGVRTKAYIDLTKSDFINSPYYHLKQNDVVMVAPNKTRQSAAMFGPQTGIYISIASVVVTILALVIRKN